MIEYTEAFFEAVAKKTGIDLTIVRALFNNAINPVEVADTLIEDYNADRQKLGEVWGTFLGYAYVDPNEAIIDDGFINRLSREFMIENEVIPLSQFGHALTAATSKPMNPFLQDKLEKALECIVSFVFCFPSDIKRYLENH